MDGRDFFFRDIPDSEPWQFVGLMGFVAVSLLMGGAFGYQFAPRNWTRPRRLVVSASLTILLLCVTLVVSAAIGIVPVKEPGVFNACAAAASNVPSLILALTAPAIAGAEFGCILWNNMHSGKQ